MLTSPTCLSVLPYFVALGERFLTLCITKQNVNTGGEKALADKEVAENCLCGFAMISSDENFDVIN